MVILLVISLLFLIVSDFKSRHIYLWQLAFFAALQVIYCVLTHGKITTLDHLLMNGAMLLILSICIGIYLQLRFGGKRKAIGWGDILFIFALTPYFSVDGFLLFMIISLLLTLAGWGLFYLNGHRAKDIPLVSTLGICYGVLLTYHTLAG